MASQAYSVLRAAILRRQQVTCLYQGAFRELCPHVLGHKGGREHVLAFQFGGGSVSGLPAKGEWRCMAVDEMARVIARQGRWYSSHGHTRPQFCVDKVDVQVPY